MAQPSKFLPEHLRLNARENRKFIRKLVGNPLGK
jgi:hypothetical protein